MKKILLLSLICLLICLCSCSTADEYSVFRKDSMSNFGQCSAMDAEGNMYYISGDDIILTSASGDERLVAESDDISWITVSDYIYCIEDDDTLVCYDIESGEKLAEKEFEADKIVVKAIDDKLLIYTYVESQSFHGAQEVFYYTGEYTNGAFEVEVFSSGTDFDGGIKNKFVAVDNLENTYLFYDNTGKVSEPGNGFDDIFYLKDTEYFGAKLLFSDYPLLPFLYNDDIYMFYWDCIFGPFLSDDEKVLLLPNSSSGGTVIETFEYNSSMFCIVQDNERFYFVKIDTENRVCEDVGFIDEADIATIIGQYNGKVYCADEAGVVYTYNLSTEAKEVFYKPDSTGGKNNCHYEFCGTNLLIYTYGVFNSEVELIAIG